MGRCWQLRHRPNVSDGRQTGRMLPDEARAALDRWLAVHDEVAPDLIEGLYVVGSLALDDWQPRSDIDIVAFTADPATDADAVLLRDAHVQATAELGRSVDGPRLAWGDVTVAPISLHRPWSLDGDFRHDGDCFEINPVTWYTLAVHGVAVRGPEPSTLGVVTDVDDRRMFVRDNVGTYWQQVARTVSAAADDPERSQFDAEVTEWCVLGIARMFATYRTGRVLSKSAAGEYLVSEAPEYAPLVERVLDIRRRSEALEPVDRSTAAATAELLERVVFTIVG